MSLLSSRRDSKHDVHSHQRECLAVLHRSMCFANKPQKTASLRQELFFQSPDVDSIISSNNISVCINLSLKSSKIASSSINARR